MEGALYHLHDTIAAVATPSGPGGVSIVRISGPQALELGMAIFAPSRAWETEQSPPPRRMIHGLALDPLTREPLDEVLWVYFPAPASYTTQDTVEIQGHAGPAASALVLQAALAAGARLAQPGEFTYRAFMGGRLDLSQAEAVGQLVGSRGAVEARLALGVLSGGLAARLAPIRQGLLTCAAQVEVGLDFPDEIPDISGPQLAETLRGQVLTPLKLLLAERTRDRVFQEGALVVLCGRPNVGKSSLFNRLLRRSRAITHSSPGTTRDSLEEPLMLGAVACRLVDTAGLGPAGDVVESLGMEQSQRRLADCDLAVVVLDGSCPFIAEDQAVLEQTRALPSLLAVNKSDLATAWQPGALGEQRPAFATSALTGQGLDQLILAMTAQLTQGASEPAPGQVVVSARQARALAHCQEAVQRVAEALGRPQPPWELLSLDLQTALEHLGQVDGQTAPDQVIEAIFSQFCVGK